LRLTTLALAFVHTFPARKHLLAFFERPSLDEAWEGFGALLAIALYLLPVRIQARGLHALWREHPFLLRAGGVLLAVAHAVPAVDHLPRFVESLAWADAWRGLGSAVAVAWFLAPLTQQRRVIVAFARLAHLHPPHSGSAADRPLEAGVLVVQDR
jgi:hypothetical protein